MSERDRTASRKKPRYRRDVEDQVVDVIEKGWMFPLLTCIFLMICFVTIYVRDHPSISSARRLRRDEDGPRLAPSGDHGSDSNISPRLRSIWEKLDNVMKLSKKKHPEAFQNAYVFDGQARYLSDILREEIDRAEDGRVVQVCEIGFNCGHSTATWLVTGKQRVHVTSFDLFNQWYSGECRKTIRNEGFHSSLLEFVPGSSSETVRELATSRNPALQCDIVFIDGSHIKPHPMTDLQNMLALAHAGTVLIMDDAKCSSWWCKDVTFAWMWAVEVGAVSDTTCFGAKGGTRGWCSGRVRKLCPPCAPRVGRDERTCECAFSLPGFPTAFVPFYRDDDYERAVG